MNSKTKKYELQRKIKSDLNTFENHNLFEMNTLERYINDFRNATQFFNFNLYLKRSGRYYYKDYDSNTYKEIIDNIYKYLKERKVRNLKKANTTIRYDYLNHTIITCIITSSKGIITVMIKREIK